MYRKYIAAIMIALISLALCVTAFSAQQAQGSIRGQISDELGGVIINVEVTLTGPNGERRTSRTDKSGVYVFNAVAAGKYTLLVKANGFAPYQQSLEVAANSREIFDIKLSVALKVEKEINVTDSAPFSTDPDNNASAIVLRGKELESLPDDPDELAEALQSLAGPSAGPSGGQIYVDGFTLEGRVPPKNSIKEVRINQNPFTAEFDRLGFGRILITTRPGTSQYHGTAMFHFNDEALNSRNAFAPERAPFQLRYYTFDVSGPLVSKRSSFFFNFQRREIDDNAVISAIALNPNLDISTLRETVLAPRREIFSSVRADYQINQNNSLLGQYVYTPANVKNAGVGDFSLRSRALDREDASHAIRLTNTSILSATTANETRFQYAFLRRNQRGDASQPAITVMDAFTGGGASYSRAAFDIDALEIHNYTTRAIRSHTLRFGGRFRNATYRDFTPANFAGTYTFAGGFAPQLDGANNVIFDSNNEPISVPISSIERYRRTLLFQRQGLSPAEIRALGGGATQFSIAGGDPEIKVTQRDAGVFLQDDWRVRDKFTFSAGLRYENQNNISSNLNFAPRLGFAWAPGKAGGKQVIRGGIGVFYDRIPVQLTMATRRFNGVNQRQFIVSDTEVLRLFPQAPSVDTLAQFALPQTIRNLDADMRPSYFTQTSLSFERQLPGNTIFTATYVYSRALHILRARNINSPLPDTFNPDEPHSGVKPLPGQPDIFSYETSGVFKQHQAIFSATGRFTKNFSYYASYALNKANSDTDGAGTFPADTYNMSNEFGRSSLDIRHRINVGTTFTTFYGVELSPAVIWRSGIPFNITTGRDFNGDTLFTERPAFATDLNEPGVVMTRFGAFDPTPSPGQILIPRNFGEGPSFYAANLSLTKTFSFGGESAAGKAQSKDKPYKLTFSIRVYNLFNTNNQGAPIGNITSPLFGVSNTTSSEGGTNSATSNRRIWLHANFRF